MKVLPMSSPAYCIAKPMHDSKSLLKLRWLCLPLKGVPRGEDLKMLIYFSKLRFLALSRLAVIGLIRFLAVP